MINRSIIQKSIIILKKFKIKVIKATNRFILLAEYLVIGSIVSLYWYKFSRVLGISIELNFADGQMLKISQEFNFAYASKFKIKERILLKSEFDFEIL